MTFNAVHDGSTVVNRSWLTSFCFGLSTLLVSNLGCDDSSSALSDAQQQAHSPEAEFDWAMERLERAISMYSPARHQGLSVKRDMSYQLISPNESRPNYTAQVTIETKSSYNPSQQAADKGDADQNHAADSADKETNFAGVVVGENADDVAISLEDLQRARPRKPKVVESLVPSPNIDDQQVYELAYLEGRWQLETKVDSEHEQMWFEYALQQ